ncbi:McrB family protein [Acinetobacter radioresistens]|uniref:McrB family protein n=1 Tax=Acinetobacter radioresistens TaxID=40216 RepID=UPI0039852359
MSYNDLVSSIGKETATLREFLLLKLAGISKTNYIDDSKVFSNKEYLSKAFCLLSLYSHQESIPKKNNFINPLAMNSWKDGHNHPTESLKKWVTSRLKNNIRGGATQWRTILNTGTGINASEQQGALTFKLSYDYLNILSNYVQNKINLSALSIWYHRFIEFDSEINIAYLEANFCYIFGITEEEKSVLFYKKNYSLNFQDHIYDTQSIREKILETPSGLQTDLITPANNAIDLGLTAQDMKFPKLSDFPIMNTEIITRVLKDFKQVILSGPPGTSKSYWAKSIAQDDYFQSNFTQIQFHPQFSYQQFVGGYVVEGDLVNYKNGILLNILDGMGDKPHLLIIDEINRANVTQVFGEILQLLDRGNSLEIKNESGSKNYSLPKNLYILATLNSTDRSLSRLDYAFKRRFAEIYVPVNASILNELCDTTDFISLATFLEKINSNLVQLTQDKDMVIGHAIFLADHVFDTETNKYKWSYESFIFLFNYKLLPLIYDYCGNDASTVEQILGEKLSSSITDPNTFKSALLDFLEITE